MPAEGCPERGLQPGAPGTRQGSETTLLSKRPQVSVNSPSPRRWTKAACFWSRAGNGRYSQKRNRLLERRGFQRPSAYPSKARFRSGYGRVGEVRYAADLPAGVAAYKGKFTASARDAEIPALVRKGAMEHWAGSRIFHAIRRFYLNKGWQFSFA